jgi:hypothetical protein
VKKLDARLAYPVPPDGEELEGLADQLAALSDRSRHAALLQTLGA